MSSFSYLYFIGGVVSVGVWGDCKSKLGSLSWQEGGCELHHMGAETEPRTFAKKVTLNH